ncbi:TPA: hypothetical protein QCR36_003926 [Bacillus cereus]|nr:hypothetical protein [Bacillus cereus]HDR4742395.1 hypothetical protein [Bacillus cereus]HDR4747982.1 hypothetical protein [Bacillus cereus]HDR4753456.1 hypothetical protein [Bacillus cereus]HDR4770665.1 hypothetical protein [Bacillus cereus]
MNPIVDMTAQEWIIYRNTLNRDTQSINIPTDVNPAMAISILSRIDNIYSTLRIQFSDLESSKERIDLMVKEIERVGLTGKNEDERKRNAVMEVRKVTTQEGLTLYDMQRESTERYMFIKGILDVLINKQNRLITINGLLKLDKDLMVSQDSFNSLGRAS